MCIFLCVTIPVACPPCARAEYRASAPDFFIIVHMCVHRVQDGLSEMVSPRDRHALEYLEDVRFLRGNAGMLVEMHFAQNPFFEEKVGGPKASAWHIGMIQWT